MFSKETYLPFLLIQNYDITKAKNSDTCHAFSVTLLEAASQLAYRGDFFFIFFILCVFLCFRSQFSENDLFFHSFFLSFSSGFPQLFPIFPNFSTQLDPACFRMPNKFVHLQLKAHW